VKTVQSATSSETVRPSDRCSRRHLPRIRCDGGAASPLILPRGVPFQQCYSAGLLGLPQSLLCAAFAAQRDFWGPTQRINNPRTGSGPRICESRRLEKRDILLLLGLSVHFPPFPPRQSRHGSVPQVDGCAMMTNMHFRRAMLSNSHDAARPLKGMKTGAHRVTLGTMSGCSA